MNTTTGDPGVHVPRQGDVVTDTVPTVVPGTAVPVAMERAHWGPIWAGLLTALTAYLVIEMFCYWVGFMDIYSGTPGTTPMSTNLWVPSIIGLIAFFLGGWMAGGSPRIRTSNNGMLNGLLVWALGIVLILAFSALGTGLIFGAVGDSFAQFLSTGTRGFIGSSPVVHMTSSVGLTRAGAGWSLLFLVVSGIAAAIGGNFGAMGRRPTVGV